MKTGNFKLGHVHLKVRNLKQAEDFYTNILGFKVSERVEKYLFLAYGDKHHELALNEIGENAKIPKINSVGLYHFAIEVPNLLALKSIYYRLKENKISARAVNHGISKVLYFSDPDANGIEFYLDTRKNNKRFKWRGESSPLDLEAL